MNLELYQKHSSLDFRHDKQALTIAYLLRAAAAFIFGFLFIDFTNRVQPDVVASLNSYFDISISGVPAFFSVFLLVLTIAFVLSFHEGVHAFVYYLDQRVPPRIGWRGLTIFAAAPGVLVKRNVMLINALAPFLVISLLGLGLIYLVPLSLLPWVFIPTLVNAAASAGDFMTLQWLLRKPESMLFYDEGDVMTAYQLRSEPAASFQGKKEGLA